MYRLTLLLFLGATGWTISVQAQNQTIKGKVTDLSEGTPLPGVSILVKGTATGTVTDVEGMYSLTVPTGAEVLVFSSVGYETWEETINNRSIINMFT